MASGSSNVNTGKGMHTSTINVTTGRMVYDSKSDKEIIEDLIQKNQEKDKKISKLSNDFNKVYGELKNAELETKRVQQVHDEFVSNIKQKQKQLDPVLKEENDRLKEELNKVNIRNAQLVKEVEELRTSISRYAGDKMSADNPYVTDLSDPNRPQRLAEKFNKLYDDSWTDAFEVFSSAYGNEKKTCEFLLNIFKGCWEYCSTLADNQLKHLNKICIIPQLTDNPSNPQIPGRNDKDTTACDNKILKDTRRTFTKEFLPNLYSHYWNSLGHLSTNQALKPYVTACLELCWYSAITDPPLDYVFTARKLDDFRAYTKNGDEVDFVVWPSMHLHKFGPLLYQGVVQFKMTGN